MTRLLAMFFLSTFTLVSAVSADPLTELKAAVTKLKGTEPVKGTVRLERTSSNEDDGEGKKEQAQISLPFSVGPQGLDLMFPAPLLQTAETEELAQSSNPEATTPVGNTLRAIDSVQLAEALNHGPVIRRLLERATLVSVNPTTANGRPVRIMVLRVDPLLSKAQKKRVKKLDLTMKVMLGEDHVPVAAELSSYVKVSMLLLSFEQRENTAWTFARRGDRLVAVRRQEEQSGSGMGQKTKSKTITTIVLE